MLVNMYCTNLKSVKLLKTLVTKYTESRIMCANIYIYIYIYILCQCQPLRWLTWSVAGLSPQRSGFDPRPVFVRLEVGRVALGKVCGPLIRFSPRQYRFTTAHIPPPVPLHHCSHPPSSTTTPLLTSPPPVPLHHCSHSPPLCISPATDCVFDHNRTFKVGTPAAANHNRVLSLLLHRASCRLNNYHKTNKCTNCM